MNIYRLIFPHWLIAYYHAFIRSNTVFCACKISLALTRWAWAQGATGCTKKALCVLCRNVYNVYSVYVLRVPVNRSYKGFLRPSYLCCPSSWAGEILISSAFSPHPPNFPNSETDLPGEPSCVESEFCGKIFCGVCGPLLGAVGWALMLKALLGR